jgi:hypothetical protein
MYKILVWGTGAEYRKYVNALRYFEVLGEIQVIGVTGRDKIYDCLDGYLFIPMDMVDSKDFDYIAITSDLHFEEIKQEAKEIGISGDKIIHGKVFLRPEFHFAKYVSLLNSNVSIIANNCWGA